MKMSIISSTVFIGKHFYLSNFNVIADKIFLKFLTYYKISGETRSDIDEIFKIKENFCARVIFITYFFDGIL
jgi:predicted secreted Zn-dependent protease